MSRSSAREQPRERRRRRRRARRRVAFLGLIGAGVVTELRYRQALAADPVRAQLSEPLAGQPVPVASADGTLIHAEVFGPSGAPTVVLAPGWTEQLEIFDLVTRGLLGRGFRVASYDLRGQGQSGLPVGGDQQIARYGEDLEAVLAAVADGRQDVIVAGHSMGGMSIMAWAEAFDAGKRVCAAALINTGAASLVDTSTLLPTSIPAEVRRGLGVRFVLGSSPPPPLSTPLSRAVLRYVAFGPTATPAQVDFMERMNWACPASVRIGGGVTLATVDVRSGARELNVPVLIVAGDRDRLTPPLHAQLLAEAVPHLAEVVLLPQTGHMSPLERPAEVVDAIWRLANGVGVVPVRLAVET